jgi:hypothetical protein
MLLLRSVTAVTFAVNREGSRTKVTPYIRLPFSDASAGIDAYPDHHL